jgi:hypothetical protein
VKRGHSGKVHKHNCAELQCSFCRLWSIFKKKEVSEEIEGGASQNGRNRSARFQNARVGLFYTIKCVYVSARARVCVCTRACAWVKENLSQRRKKEEFVVKVKRQSKNRYAYFHKAAHTPLFCIITIHFYFILNSTCKQKHFRNILNTNHVFNNHNKIKHIQIHTRSPHTPK